MGANHHLRFAIPDRSFVSITKRDIAKLALGWGFSEVEIGKINIAVSELVTNLIKFSPQGGEILVRPIGQPIDTLEIISLDKGPGMDEPVRMQEDGVSTYGSAGEGLGAIKRQSSLFDLYTLPGFGTVVLVHISKGKPATKIVQPSPKLEVGFIMVPLSKEIFCGDGFDISISNTRTDLLVLDGLGHGAHAHEASQQATKAFREHLSLDPANRMRAIHNSIKKTRGAVGLAATIRNNTIEYCGIGNISGKLFTMEASLLGAQYKNIISYNGILGHNIPTTLNNQQLEWVRNKTLVLHSDGIKSRWDLNKYTNLLRHHPTTIASVLYLDHSRHTDDTLVVVCKAKL